MKEHWFIEYAREVYEENRKKNNSHVIFLNDLAANSLINDLENYPHAFVLACCMDRQIKADRAWRIPLVIKSLCTEFSVAELCSLDLEWYRKVFAENNLHRFNDVMSEVFYNAVHRIQDQYHGDASEIWSNCPSSAAVVYRFLEFDGVGIKIATMAANILCRQFFIPFSDRCSIDVSPDTHIMRVFPRCGLVPHGASREMVIYKARELSPEFPGIVDGPCWELGVHYCHPFNPECGTCPVSKDCPKLINAAKEQGAQVL